MTAHSPEEEELHRVSVEAASSASTNPWGPVGTVLAKHAGGTGRAIGIQDSTVIDRAIGSPGMLKPLVVHGFIIKSKEGREPADLDTVVLKVRQQIETSPNISTAVIIPHTNHYYPSHVLSSDSFVGTKLTIVYPNATHSTDLQKRGVEQPRGPWRVLVTSTGVGPAGPGSVLVDDPEQELRFVHPGDAALLFRPGDSVPFAVGRLHHVYPIEDGGIVLVFDRYRERPQSGEK